MPHLREESRAEKKTVFVLIVSGLSASCGSCGLEGSSTRLKVHGQPREGGFCVERGACLDSVGPKVHCFPRKATGLND